MKNNLFICLAKKSQESQSDLNKDSSSDDRIDQHSMISQHNENGK